MSWTKEMEDGFAFAALLADRISSSPGEGQPPPEAFVSRGAEASLRARLDEVRAGQATAKDLIPALRRRPPKSLLEDPSPRVRAVIGALLTPAERRRASSLSALPPPRRGFEVHPGLASFLAAWASDAVSVECEAVELREWKEEEAAWPKS